jgi:hypothetical protein
MWKFIMFFSKTPGLQLTFRAFFQASPGMVNLGWACAEGERNKIPIQFVQLEVVDFILLQRKMHSFSYSLWVPVPLCLYGTTTASKYCTVI